LGEIPAESTVETGILNLEVINGEESKAEDGEGVRCGFHGGFFINKFELGARRARMKFRWS